MTSNSFRTKRSTRLWKRASVPKYTLNTPVSWYTTWLASMWYAIPCFSRMLRFNLQFMAGPPNRLANTVIASLSLLLPPGATHPVMW